MPPSSSGKADGVQIVAGSTIPSQHVVASKKYLTARTIQSLTSVGALTGTPKDVASRADGIIANLPANGRIEAAELVRMEDPAIFATLFPNEQAALPTLWPLLEAPGGNPVAVSVPVHQLDVTEQRTPPSGLVPPASILISSLAVEVQTVARRVQLVFNADADAQTIQVGDIDQVLVMPQAFTPSEVEQLKLIRGEFMRRATSACEAKAIVPEPGKKSTSTNVGALTLKFDSDLVLRETRTVATGSLVLEHRLAATVQGNANDAVITLALDNAAEHVLSGASNPLPQQPAGQVVIERYVGGQRVEAKLITLPPHTVGETKKDISKYLDYKLVTPGQAALVKNVTSTTNTGGHPTANFSHELTASPNLGDAAVLAAVAAPAITLPTGRYEVSISTLGQHWIEIYPNGVIWSDDRRLLPGIANTSPISRTFEHREHPYMWQFTPQWNHLHYWAPQREAGVQVTLENRVK